jgi:hypothetical protein
MPFESILEQSRQAREKLKHFQEDAFRHRHNMAKRDSQKSPALPRQPGLFISP